jgi:hypothetical protein
LTSVERRVAIEMAGMRAATAHYEARAYAVEDVHLSESFELRCTRGGDEVHVEVKSTTGAAAYVLLTRGEVLHATDAARAALFVLPGVRLRIMDDKLVVVGSAKPVVIDPLGPHDRDLSPISYRYRLG